jgi:hypothetical protein
MNIIESPLASLAATLIYIAFCAAILTVQWWGPWLDRIGGCAR